MIDVERYFTNPRLNMAPADYAPDHDWRDDYDGYVEEEGENDE